MGLWYEQNRDKQCFYESGECVVANYTLNDDGTIKIRNDEYFEKFDFWKGAEGVGTIDDPKKHEGYLKVSIRGSPPGDYKIIATDYTNYSVVFSCMEVFGFSFENLWILTRDTVPEQKVIDQAV